MSMWNPSGIKLMFNLLRSGKPIIFRNVGQFSRFYGQITTNGAYLPFTWHLFCYKNVLVNLNRKKCSLSTTHTMATDQQKLDYIKQHIGEYPDFPKPGILFRDIFAALTDGKVCTYIKELLVNYVKQHYPDVDVIVGLESRGFLFNLLIAAELCVGCAPIRKKGKLPGECVSIEYKLEYGSDIFEMQTSAIKKGQKVLLIDDLLATGGSLDAAVQLVRKAGGNVVASVVIIELVDLKGRQKIDCDIHSFIQY